MNAPLVLMTDFGTQDSYVGVMKGVIATIAPNTNIIDLTHHIRPQDVAHGAYTLRISVPYFPAGTCFCCVVDPGVGSQRRAIAVELGDWRFVLPDNGLLTHLLNTWSVHRAVTLTNPRYQLAQISTTFHGRDIFSPAAAHLLAGTSLEAFGSLIDPNTLQRLPLPPTQREGNQLLGSVMHIDHFGNLITSIHQEMLTDEDNWQISLKDTQVSRLPLHNTFADVPIGQPVAYIGSDGFLELAVRNGNAAEAWGVGLNWEVRAEI